MSIIDGTWDVSLKTPIGTLAVRYVFEQTPEGIHGHASSKDETVPLEHITTQPAENGDNRITWQQKVAKPMRLNLDFDVIITGDEMTGHSRAGKLPRTRVTGHRTHA